MAIKAQILCLRLKAMVARAVAGKKNDRNHDAAALRDMSDLINADIRRSRDWAR